MVYVCDVYDVCVRCASGDKMQEEQEVSMV